ncbi:MAG: universal stress protein [Acidobacteriaceae bacterium]|nr:universal stress protein [Acidobacteriaceae bacterium]
MFKKITVAYNDSPEANRALAQAIDLAKALGAELSAITVIEDLPAYAAFAAAADSTLVVKLNEDAQEQCKLLHSSAQQCALRKGIQLKTHLLDGEPCQSIVRFLLDTKTDLVVIGLHRNTSHISRLWSTVYELALDAPCSVLGVH